jgi:serine/threonine protein kinase
MTRGSLKGDEASSKQIMRAIVESIHYMHEAGVVHRDMNPTNVFIHEEEGGQIIVKVLDFNVSKLMEP